MVNFGLKAGCGRLRIASGAPGLGFMIERAESSSNRVELKYSNGRYV